MTATLVAWSARHPWLVFAAALIVAIAGVMGWRALSRDAVPDLSDPQVAVVAEWMGRSAAEVEQTVTQVLTRGLTGVDGARSVRGVSMSGMAYVEVVLGSASALDRQRQAVADRVASLRAALPSTVRLQVGPAVSSASWVLQYALFDPSKRMTPLLLRRYQDDVLGPALAAVPGVAEVSSLGGGAEQVRIEVKSEELQARALAFSDIVSRVREALAGSRRARYEELEALRVDASGADVDPGGASGPTEPSARPGAAARLGDVANVRIDDEMPDGVADFEGTWEAVGGIVLARPEAHLFSLVDAVKGTLDRERAKLPSGVELAIVYDRTELATRTHRTLVRALAEEVAAAAIVIVLLLRHLRSAVIPLLTLPVAVLSTFAGMWMLGVPATILSLGGIGIALGMAVDADVVALEACHRGLEGVDAPESGERRRVELIEAARRLVPATVTSLAITAIAFLPVFAFNGEAGKLLTPLAWTKTLVVGSAAVVALTLGPALRDQLLRGRLPRELDHPLTRTLVRAYRPFVHFALRRPVLTLATAIVALASCVPIAGRLGGEFLPRLDEGDLLLMPTTLPGVKPERAAAQMRRQDGAIAAFPEVDTVFGKVGRADTATDPAPFSMAETTVRLRPQAQWPLRSMTRWYSGWAPESVRRVLGWLWPDRVRETPAELLVALDRATRTPGWTSAWTAPARARRDMMSTGFRTTVGIRIISSERDRLAAIGRAAVAVAARVPGARSAVLESSDGEPRMAFDADADALRIHGADPSLVQATADLVIAGGHVGDVERGGRRVRVMVVPGSAGLRGQEDRLRDTTVRTGAAPGQPIALALLGRPRFEDAPSVLRTENGERVAYVYVDLDDGVDPASYVDRARREMDRARDAGELQLRPGERIEWAGQYALYAAGARRFRWIVGLASVSMVGLLAWQLGSFAEALIVSLSVPFALVGSVWTLFLLGYPLSAPVWVGLLSAAGLAMQTGVVTVVYIDESFRAAVRAGKMRNREDIVRAHGEGTIQRLRPKVMTVATMGAALVPLLWASGAGAEIVKRVAAPMIGGLATSTLLTLEVLPVLYTIWRVSQLRRATRSGRFSL